MENGDSRMWDGGLRIRVIKVYGDGGQYPILRINGYKSKKGIN